MECSCGFNVRERTYQNRPKSKIRPFLYKHVLYGISMAMTIMILIATHVTWLNFIRIDLSPRVCDSPLSYRQLLWHNSQATKPSRFQRLFFRKSLQKIINKLTKIGTNVPTENINNNTVLFLLPYRWNSVCLWQMHVTDTQSVTPLTIYWSPLLHYTRGLQRVARGALCRGPPGVLKK
jgi:hypothetical protein